MTSPTLTLDNVMSVYSGKVNACCCGCSGKHTYASAHVVAAGVYRGYPVASDEVNDRTVKIIFNKAINAGVEKISNTIYSVDTDTRTYIICVKGH